MEEGKMPEGQPESAAQAPGEPANPYVRTSEDAPRSLRFVAYVLWAMGAVWLWGMVMGPLWGDESRFKLGIVLWPLAAVGLLKKRSGWRTFTMVMLGLGIVSLAALAALRAYETWEGKWEGSGVWVFGAGAVRAVAIAGFGWFAGLGLLWCWQFLVLRSKAVKEWFTKEWYVRVTIARSTKRMFAVWTVAALVPFLCYWAAPGYLKERPEDTEDTRGSTIGAEHVSYGCRYGRLAYVVFVEKPMGEGVRSPVKKDRGKGEATLETPKGERVRLPNETQLYEIVDGEVRTSPERVTLEELEAFLKSGQRYTIEGLLKFAKGERTAWWQEFGAGDLDPSKISNLRIGMSMDEATKLLEPSRPMILSVPALSYTTKEGDAYYLAWFNEDGSLASDTDGLQFVVFSPKGTTEGTYVLPEAKRGQAFKWPGADGP